jgi:alpha-ketoglutarate-dependent taurine dioxygenase
VSAPADFGPATRVADRTAGLPVVVTAVSRGARLDAVVEGAREALESALDEHGALLFRGFEVGGVEGFESICARLGQLMPYRDRATPRTLVNGNVLTATDYPPNVAIFLHNENVYAAEFPARLFFHCVRPADDGGETPLADVRRVLERLPGALSDEFASRGLRYARTFGRGFGLDWRDAFQTDERAEMERYCRQAGIQVEWNGETLRTWQVRPAIAAHPRTGAKVWLNHLVTLHVSSLEPAKRRMLLKMFGEHELPNNVYYGDGSPIADDVVAAVRSAYEAEAVAPAASCW